MKIMFKNTIYIILEYFYYDPDVDKQYIWNGHVWNEINELNQNELNFLNTFLIKLNRSYKFCQEERLFRQSKCLQLILRRFSSLLLLFFSPSSPPQTSSPSPPPPPSLSLSLHSSALPFSVLRSHICLEEKVPDLCHRRLGFTSQLKRSRELFLSPRDGTHFGII